jgi:hypothetical protein
MSDDVSVRDNPGASRYEIQVDGKRAGFTEYVRHGKVVDLLHTEIGDEYGGRGLATELVRSTLDDARQHGAQVLPYCPFVKEFLEKNPDYRDLVPADKRARFGLDV